VVEQDGIAFLDLAAAAREMGDDLRAAAEKVIASGWYVGGTEVSAFEQAWAAACNRAHCIGTGNGLDALALTLRALGVGPGDKVVVPSFTFIATWLAVSVLGATPVPVEVRETTANLDPDRLGDAIDARTRAIVPVHLYGQPAEMDAISAIARERDIPVVEDAAQAHGARWRGRPVGSLGQAAAFSFYPAKNLGALGDAGAAVCDDHELADRIRLLGNYGARVKYDHEVQGVNSRLDALQAAFLQMRLKRLETWNDRRRVIAERYRAGLADLEWLELPVVVTGAEPVWHLFVVRCDRRDDLRNHLARRRVNTALHYPVAPHRSSAYRDLDVRLPVADKLAARSLSLPMGPHLAAADADLIIQAVRGFDPVSR
jgi:dTDP-3-amino-3,4,6-trideoxy-alpha-D-glucose transaminase